MSGIKEETIRVIAFDGKKIHWSSWKEKFLARAKKKGYKDVLLGKTPVISVKISLNPIDPDYDDQVKAREHNEAAYADLILSIDTTKSTGCIAFNLVKGSKSDDFPDGNASVSWSSLVKEFNPKSSTSRTKLHKELCGARLRSGADPLNFVTYMEDLRD